MTLIDRLKTAFERGKDRTAITDRYGELSFAELDALAGGFAAELASAGVGPGDRVALVLRNSRWPAVAYAGAWYAGAIPVPINFNYTVPEIRAILANAEPVAAVVDDNKLADVVAADRENGKAGIRSWYVAGESGDGDARPLATIEGKTTGLPAVNAPEEGAILYTSGTTGSPKGVELRQSGMLFAADSYRDRLHITEEDVILGAAPMFHSMGLVAVFLESLVTGHRIVLTDGFPFPKILKLIADEGITLFRAVPPVFEAIGAMRWEPGKYDFSRIRLVLSGAAPLGAQTRERAMERLDCDRFYEGYGITETTTLVSIGPITEPHRVGSVGKPIDGIEIHMKDPDGRELPRGERGELWIKTPGVMKGYYKNPQATAEVLQDGWFRSGDIGHFDEDGYLHITDRIRDVIFVGGSNVYPREIEEALIRHPGVSRAAVVRMNHPASGEAPLAYVVGDGHSELKISELVTHLRSQLAAHKIPKRIELVDELPTSSSGKVLKKELEKN